MTAAFMTAALLVAAAWAGMAQAERLAQQTSPSSAASAGQSGVPASSSSGAQSPARSATLSSASNDAHPASQVHGTQDDVAPALTSTDTAATTAALPLSRSVPATRLGVVTRPKKWEMKNKNTFWKVRDGCRDGNV